MLLPIIKIFMRNVMARTLLHLNDEIPEVVLMNVEVFNSLFMSYCMQNSPSIWTTLGLIAIDGAQMLASMHDVSDVIQRLRVLKERVNTEHARLSIDDPTGQTENCKRVPKHILYSPTGLVRSKLVKRFSLSRKVFLTRDADDVEGTVDVTQLDLEYAVKVRKLLYITEFVLLINYVEVIVPHLSATAEERVFGARGMGSTSRTPPGW
ncbi:hypothetical protein PF001_g31913, partial [Phytophthora fragariae]